MSFIHTFVSNYCLAACSARYFFKEAFKALVDYWIALFCAFVTKLVNYSSHNGSLKNSVKRDILYVDALKQNL